MITYRKGTIGALTDEYEKALNEFKTVIKSISENDFLKTDETETEDFKSIKSIVSHVIKSGYIYSNYVRKKFEQKKVIYEFDLINTEDVILEIDKMFVDHNEVFQDKWMMSGNEMNKIIIVTHWTTYDLEALLEHAIVHILRHRLQIQKKLMK